MYISYLFSYSTVEQRFKNVFVSESSISTQNNNDGYAF